MTLRLRLQRMGNHIHVRMWASGAMNGELVFRPGEWDVFRATLEAGWKATPHPPDWDLIIEESK